MKIIKREKVKEKKFTFKNNNNILHALVSSNYACFSFLKRKLKVVIKPLLCFRKVFIFPWSYFENCKVPGCQWQFIDSGA